MPAICKHPKVRVVAREDDVEYVECEECGEVFDADEYKEMTLEELNADVSPPDAPEDEASGDEA